MKTLMTCNTFVSNHRIRCHILLLLDLSLSHSICQPNVNTKKTKHKIKKLLSAQRLTNPHNKKQSLMFPQKKKNRTT